MRAAGGIAPLVKLLSSPHASVVREASGALWNCTAGDAASVAEVAKEDGVSVLLQLLAVDYDEIAENCTGVLCNIVTDSASAAARRVRVLTACARVPQRPGARPCWTSRAASLR